MFFNNYYEHLQQVLPDIQKLQLWAKLTWISPQAFLRPLTVM